MTIKQKVRLSNIMMVLIPILFTAIMIVVCGGFEKMVDLVAGLSPVPFHVNGGHNDQKTLT